MSMHVANTYKWQQHYTCTEERHMDLACTSDWHLDVVRAASDSQNSNVSAYISNNKNIVRRGGGIKERLDRAFANASWKSLFSASKVTHLKSGKFDHIPIMVELHQPLLNAHIACFGLKRCGHNMRNVKMWLDKLGVLKWKDTRCTECVRRSKPQELPYLNGRGIPSRLDNLRLKVFGIRSHPLMPNHTQQAPLRWRRD